MPELQNPFFSSFLRLSIIRASLKENRACNMMSLLTILIWTGRKHARELQWMTDDHLYCFACNCMTIKA